MTFAIRTSWAIVKMNIVTAKIAFIFTFLSAVQMYDFHIFTVVYSPLQGFIWNQNNDQLPVDLLVQLAERWSGIAEVMGSNLY